MTFCFSILFSSYTIRRRLVLPGDFTVKADEFSTDCPSHFIFTYKGSLLGDGVRLYNTNSALHL